MKRAVLIAIDNYPDGSGLPPLRCAQRDAIALGHIMATRCGFAVEMLLGVDATRSHIERMVLSTVDADTFVFFFAGHGQFLDGSFRLHTVDSEWNGVGTLPFRDLAAIWQTRTGYRNVLAILDACRSQGIRNARLLNSRVASPVPFEAACARDIQAQAGEVGERWIEVLYGCSEGELSYEDPKEGPEDSLHLGHGVLTAGLLHALKSPGERLDSHLLCARAADWMRMWSRADHRRPRQQATIYGPKSERPPIVFWESSHPAREKASTLETFVRETGPLGEGN